MPTGYTASIKDDVSFEEFVWDCARGFGALMHMRDEAWGSPVTIPKESSSFYEECLENAKRRLEKLENVNKEDWKRDYFKSQEEAKALDAAREEEKLQLKEKYTKMLEKVEAWQPPTERHVELKKFMVQQLKDSIQFDCTIFVRQPEREVPSLELEIHKCKKDIERFTQELERERVRTKERKDWILALDGSVPCPNKEGF